MPSPKLSNYRGGDALKPPKISNVILNGKEKELGWWCKEGVCSTGF